MSAREVAVEVLLWAGVALELICCMGLLVLEDPLDRLHLSSPSAFGVALISLAVLLQMSFSLIANKALLITAFTIVGSPVVTHALGRAARVLTHGDWRIARGEAVEVRER